jgi:hypothetical protein
MTTAPPSPDRDAVLDAAWHAHSHEEPPSHLDAAILAAAHRAVGSAPRDVAATAAEATSPQRWWMPLAAAATIGAVALGILQLAPEDFAPTAPASDMAPRDRPAAVARKDAAKPDATTPATGAAPTAIVTVPAIDDAAMRRAAEPPAPASAAAIAPP